MSLWCQRRLANTLQDVDRALELANEMRARNIERNVHTYTVRCTATAGLAVNKLQQVFSLSHMQARDPSASVQALMNVCIKCGRCPLALETYHKMRQDGCAPNVVTFNTLIDVYGKMGQWEQAVKVLSIMKGEVRASPVFCPGHVLELSF